MATMNRREMATGQKSASESVLPLILQKKIREELAEEVSSKTSEAFAKAFKRELAKSQYVLKKRR